MPSATSSEGASALALKGRPLRWGPAGLILLAVCTALGLWLRLSGLADEGFADDEVHKWLAAVEMQDTNAVASQDVAGLVRIGEGHPMS